MPDVAGEQTIRSALTGDESNRIGVDGCGANKFPRPLAAEYLRTYALLGSENQEQCHTREARPLRSQFRVASVKAWYASPRRGQRSMIARS
jgi:hypothetical protein